MAIPFTSEQFVGVIAAYNRSVWPMQIVLYVFALAAISFAVKNRKNSDRYITLILSFFWLWMGIVYHLLNFISINPAAYAFGVLNILQGMLFLLYGLKKTALSFRFQKDLYGYLGALFMLYGLIVYPVIGSLFGHAYPKLPTFGLPCPTTIFTFGLLLWTNKCVPLPVLIIPFIWSVIGFSAAFKFGIWEDVGLLVAGVAGSLIIIIKNKSGQSADSI